MDDGKAHCESLSITNHCLLKSCTAMTGRAIFFATWRYGGDDQAPERDALMVITLIHRGELGVRGSLVHSALALQILPTSRLEPAVTWSEAAFPHCLSWGKRATTLLHFPGKLLGAGSL